MCERRQRRGVDSGGAAEVRLCGQRGVRDPSEGALSPVPELCLWREEARDELYKNRSSRKTDSQQEKKVFS